MRQTQRPLPDRPPSAPYSSSYPNDTQDAYSLDYSTYTSYPQGPTYRAAPTGMNASPSRRTLLPPKPAAALDLFAPSPTEDFQDDGYYQQHDLHGSNGVDGGTAANGSKRKWIIIGVLAGLVAVGIAVGIAVWQVGLHKTAASTSGTNSSTSSGVSGTSTGDSSLQKIPGTAGAVLSSPTDPSVFQKDPAYHLAFYGLGYTPYLAQEPDCGATLANVTEDIQLMSQVTTRLHMYGSSCNQSALVLQAIIDTKVNMTVWLGTFVGNNNTVNDQQLSETLAVLQTYGTEHVGGVTIGNEFILDSLDPVTAIAYLTATMATFRSTLAAAKVSVPVGTADAGSEITTILAEGSDFVMSNVHPFFGGLPIAQAASWTNSYYQEFDIAPINLAPNVPRSLIGETGWPTGSLSVANATDGAAVAGVAELQIYLNDYVCAANANGTQYFWFEAFDEPWQAIYGGVEPYWGLWDANKVLKSVTLPTCVSP